jgi:hypothetical protein
MANDGPVFIRVLLFYDREADPGIIGEEKVAEKWRRMMNETKWYCPQLAWAWHMYRLVTEITSLDAGRFLKFTRGPRA